MDFQNILQSATSYQYTWTKEVTGHLLVSPMFGSKLMQFHRPLFAWEIRNGILGEKTHTHLKLS